MERYQVTRREAIVAEIEKAVEASGGRLIERPDPRSAPFECKVACPDGRIVDLVCYAFTANKYRQEGRPVDEHRFQIKYGSEFDRYHHIFLDPEGKRITLMFGVHLELGVFVGVDARMHTPTWFSSSVEMKEADLEQARAQGWHGWERERSDARRKAARPLESLRTEAVIGFRPDQFLRYVDFEEHASGLDAGERLQLSDRIGDELAAGRFVHPRHVLETQLGLSALEVLDVIGAHFRLAAAVRGSVAEHHLGRFLSNVPGMSGIKHLDEDGRPDFEVMYKRRPVRIECKNVLARPTSRGSPRVDFQKTRASKGNPCSRYYEPTQFEVLAACLHPITRSWEFTFAATSALERLDDGPCKGRLSPRVIVEGTGWQRDLPTLLDALPS